MALTELEVKKAKPTEKPYKIADGGGLSVLVHTNGGKYWRLSYRYAGKQKTLALGIYPDVSLTEARDHRDQARKLLANNSDPSDVKRLEKQKREIISANSFEAVAKDWFERHLSQKAETTKDRVIRRMERFVFPYLGKRPISEITAPDILQVVRRVETHHSLDTAHRVQIEIGPKREC